MPRVLKVVKQKLNGNAGSWLPYHLDDDEVGSWLFHPEGTSYTGRRADGREATCFSGVPEDPGCPVLYFVPHQGGWVAAWRHTPWTGITVDLSRPVTRSGDVWSFVDLELDLWHLPDDNTPPGTDPHPRLSRSGRTVGIADDDELDDAVSHEWITPAEAARTRDEARYVADLILDGVYPFTQDAWRRFEQAIARKLRPPQQPQESHCRGLDRLLALIENGELLSFLDNVFPFGPSGGGPGLPMARKLLEQVPQLQPGRRPTWEPKVSP